MERSFTIVVYDKNDKYSSFPLVASSPDINLCIKEAIKNCKDKGLTTEFVYFPNAKSSEKYWSYSDNNFNLFSS